MFKIGLAGTHGSGKTTLANKLEKDYLKSRERVYVVREAARSCPHKLGTIEAQEWIWHEQMAREKYAMMQDVDVIICDRTVMDNLMYFHAVIKDTIHMLPNRIMWYNCESLYADAVAWMPTYSQVIRLPLNLEYLKADDPIRPKDVAYARRIDALFDRFVQPYATEG